MKNILRIIASVFIGFIILAISGSISIGITENLGESYSWLMAPILHTAMLILSVALIYFFSRKDISSYGLKMAEPKYLKHAVINGSMAAILVGICSVIFGELFPDINTDPADEFNFIQIIIFVWIYASICEEFLSRGLIQSFLSPLIGYRIRIFNFHISLPILVVVLFFGLKHFGLITTGADLLFVCFIVFFGIIVGIMAGYYREISGSIIPAIIIHALFNIWGTILNLIGECIS